MHRQAEKTQKIVENSGCVIGTYVSTTTGEALNGIDMLPPRRERESKRGDGRKRERGERKRRK